MPEMMLGTSQEVGALDSMYLTAVRLLHWQPAVVELKLVMERVEVDSWWVKLLAVGSPGLGIEFAVCSQLTRLETVLVLVQLVAIGVADLAAGTLSIPGLMRKPKVMALTAKKPTATDLVVGSVGLFQLNLTHGN